MPRGVGSGVGWQKREVDGSMGINERGDEVGEEGGEAMAIAVDICCAITQPTIFSRWWEEVVDIVAIGMRNR